MILDNLIEVKLGSLNINHYHSFGYQGKCGDTIKVFSKHLQDGTSIKEERKCDCCGEIYSRRHSQHIKSFNIWGKDICNKCSHTKEYKNKIQEKREQTCLIKYGEKNPSNIVEFQNNRTATMLEKYGVENYFQAQDFDKKRKESNLKKYGVEFAQQSEEIQKKIEECCLKKYGVKNPTLNKEIREKQIQSCIKKYGSETSLGNQEVRDKGKKTMMDKYGYDNARKCPQLQEKAMQTREKNGNVPTSMQQIQLKDILSEMYPQYNVKLNYPVSSLSLDIALFIDEKIKIDVEYDGNYWHKNYQKDRRRDEFLKSQGFKILRVRSRRQLPTKQQIEESVNQLKEGRNFVQIILKDWENN